LTGLGINEFVDTLSTSDLFPDSWYGASFDFHQAGLFSKTTFLFQMAYTFQKFSYTRLPKAT